ncbi:hypothetical protein [Deinococcus lacus]|uniref:hypothetical protein n=1 Tax=Deinococcus lacus TaxID=392561 RepID=UPI0036D3EF1F
MTVFSLLVLLSLAGGAGGQLAELFARPLGAALGFLAALLPLALLTLGLEILLGQPPLTFLKAFFRLVSQGLAALGYRAQGLIEERKEGREVARARGKLRSALRGHQKELEQLHRSFPLADLQLRQAEVRGRLEDMRDMDESEMEQVWQELEGWQAQHAGLLSQAAADLAQQVSAEPAALQGEIDTLAGHIRAGRHELGAELPSTQASAALEELRRALVTDMTRFAQRAARLERERAAAQQLLAGAAGGRGKKRTSLGSSALIREEAAARKRRTAWEQLAGEFAQWRTHEPHYAGWPALAAAYDRAPTEAAAALAHELERRGYAALPERAEWQRRLEQGEFDGESAAGAALVEQAAAHQPPTGRSAVHAGTAPPSGLCCGPARRGPQPLAT